MFLNNDPMRYITGAVLLSLSSGVLAGTKGKKNLPSVRISYS